MKPKIGIIICGISDATTLLPKYYVSCSYVEAICECGGIPIIVPYIKDTLYEDYLNLCQGFLFCGGQDIAAHLFHEEPLPLQGETSDLIDQFQILLMQHCLQANKPILAICRGLQVLNVACGGTLYQDLSYQPENAIMHMQHTALRSDLCHRLHITTGSQLHQILGNGIMTNSFHHQSIQQPGTNLRISARTSDGTIEALESVAHHFVIGVQWHPEAMIDTSPQMKRLFQEFIRASTDPDH